MEGAGQEVKVAVMNGLDAAASIPVLNLTCNSKSPPAGPLCADSVSTGTQLDERVRRLTAENLELRAQVQQNNQLLTKAHASMTKQKAEATRERDECTRSYEQAKLFVGELKGKMADQERVIQGLKEQLAQPAHGEEEAALLQSHVKSLTGQLESVKVKNAQLTRELAELKQQTDERLASEAVQKGSSDSKMSELLDEFYELNASFERTKKTNEELTRQRHELTQKSDNLMAQLVSAEDTLLMKDDEIARLKKQVELLVVHAEQANIYKADFHAERESRIELHDRKLLLEERLAQLETQLSRVALNADPANRVAANPGQPRPQNDVIRQSHIVPREDSPYFAVTPVTNQSNVATSTYPGQAPPTDRYPGQAPPADKYQPLHYAQQESQASPLVTQGPPPATARPMGQQPGNGARGYSFQQTQPAPALLTSEILDLECPLCPHLAPDYDSLQLHVNDNHPEIIN